MRRIFLFAVVLASFAPSVASASEPATLDGPAPCSSGAPAYGWHGWCGTYNGNNTWYGSHGLGFPTPTGWGLCAQRPAGGGGYPAPSYRYVLSSAPAGASLGRSNELGYAFSMAQSRGWWSAGNPGQFSADQLGVAAKLLYDHFVWSTPLPSVDAGTQRALNALSSLMNGATGMSAPPTLTLALSGGGTTLETSGTLNVAATLPGAGALVGLSVTLRITNATFVASGSSTIQVVTNAAGFASAAFTTNSVLPSQLTATASASLAQPGLLFYGPTQIITSAQVIVAMRPAVIEQRTLSLTSTGQPTGTLQIQKSSDVPSYLGVEGAVFEIRDLSGAVVDTLETDGSGMSDVSEPLAPGTYQVLETRAPIGFRPAPAFEVTVVANTNTVVAVGASQGDASIPGSVVITKSDAESSTVLAGAVYSLTYDPTNTLNADGPTVTCTTDEAGHCTLDGLAVGNYEVREVTPPPGYLAQPDPFWIHVGPNAQVVIHRVDHARMVTLFVRKFSSTTNEAVPGATYDLYSVDPGPPTATPSIPGDSEVISGLTFQQRGTTNSQGQLTFHVRAGYRWCVKEVSSPPQYDLDPGVHCTGVIDGARMNLALAERPSMITLSVHKFTAGTTTGIPNAYYALFVKGSFPAGFTPPPHVEGVQVPEGHELWAIAKTDEHGHLTFGLPGGYAWCVQELTAPEGYVLDPALRCTGVLTTSSSSASSTIAVPELAYTGAHLVIGYIGALLLVSGLTLRTLSRRRA